MGRTTTTQLKRSFCQWKLVLHQRNLSVINKFIAMSAFTVGVVEAWIKLTLGQKEKACVLKDETPLFITSTSLSLQRTDLLMNNDVNTLKTGSTTDGTFERTVTNRDWMKVIHFNHTTARPPSHYPRGLLYLSTFSFLLLFFLVLADGKAIALWDVCPWRIRQQKEIFIHTVDVEWEQAVSNSTLSSLIV